jgi:hypothetical protein
MRSQTPKVGFGDSYSFGQISDMWGQPSIFVHRLISRDLVATDEGGLVTLTGELLRDLILKPTHRLPADPNTQTTHPKMTNSRTQIAGPAVAYVLRHHIGSGGRIRTCDLWARSEACPGLLKLSGSLGKPRGVEEVPHRTSATVSERLGMLACRF